MDNLGNIIAKLSEKEIEFVKERLKQETQTFSIIFEFYRNKDGISTLPQALKGTAEKGSIPVIKNRLKELILEQVRLVNPKTTYAEFYKLLDYIEWLSKNNLYEEAKFYIQKVQEAADLLDFRFFYGATRKWNYQVIELSDGKRALANIKEAMNLNELKYLEEINGFEITEFNFLVKNQFKKKQLPNDNEAVREFEGLKKHKVFQMDASDSNLTFSECQQIAKSKSLIYMALGDNENSFNQAMIFFERLKRDEPVLKKYDLEGIFWGLQFVMEAIARAKKRDSYKEVIDLAFTLLNEDIKRNTEIYLRLLAHKLKYFSSFGPAEEFELALKQITDEMDGIEEGKVNYTRVDIDFLLVQILFGRGKYEEAGNRNSRLIDYTTGTDIRLETQRMAEVMRLILDFCVGLKKGGEIARDIITRAEGGRRSFEKRAKKGDYKLEIAIFRFIEKFGNTVEKNKRIKYLQKLEKQVDEISREDGQKSAFRIGIYKVKYWTEQCRVYLSR